jgi:phage shock protein PspC (stress-responsive transcriptional regulator)
MVGGVGAGLARYFGINPTLIRLAFVLAVILTYGLLVFVNLVLWNFLPIKPGEMKSSTPPAPIVKILGYQDSVEHYVDIDSEELPLENTNGTDVLTVEHEISKTASNEVLALAKATLSRLTLIWADGRYQGPLERRTPQALDLTVDLVSPPDMQNGFQVLPLGRVIERTFAWLDRFRCLARDWEAASWSGCAFICIAASNLVAR